MKPGSILKITITDFVTYRYAEVYPGSNLNLIIGPNGNGKSTIAAAIILGLGGSPKVIGHSTKVSDYIKHNCEKAIINIRLQNYAEGDYFDIIREFNVYDKSLWKLNNQTVSFKAIETVIKQFNIQVDNLCQFLPQDRVADFVKMNKQQLLEQTQIALCRNDLIDKQKALIDQHVEHKNILARREKHTNHLQEAKDANIQMEGKVRSFNKRKRYLNHIEHLDRKLSWISYETFRASYEDAKTDKAKATEVFNKQKAASKPIESAINNAKKVVGNLQNKASEMQKSVHLRSTEVNLRVDKAKNSSQQLQTVLRDMEVRIKHITERNNEVELNLKKLESYEDDRRALQNKYGNEESCNNFMKQRNQKLKVLSNDVGNVLEKKEAVESTKRNDLLELNSYENELRMLENIKQQRLQWLRNTDRDAYTAVMWLRNNQDKFKGEIFEPIALELNVLNPKNAIYLENIIPVKDRIAFTCTLKEDMALLCRLLREEQKLNVNVIHSGLEHPPLTAYKPGIPIEGLGEYGMFAYVNSLISGPEPIMKYLCRNYQVHSIPVGDHTTNKCFDKLPKSITKFFSDNFRFSITFSQYTGEKSTRQTRIISDGSFSTSADPLLIENLNSKIRDIRNRHQNIEEQIKEFNLELAGLNKQQTTIREEMKDLNNNKHLLSTLESRIRVVQSKIQQLRQEVTTKEEVEAETKIKIKEIVKKIIDNQYKIQESYKNYLQILIQYELEKSKLKLTRQQITILENKSQDILRLCREAADTLNNISKICDDRKNKAKAALQKAKSLSNGCTPDQDGFDEFRSAYDGLSDQIEKLEKEREQTESKIDCLNTANDNEMQEYDKREKLIVVLENQIKEENNKIGLLDNDINQLLGNWLQPLQTLITDISTKFSAAFEQMGYAGEVYLYKGQDEKDFAEYGISIKVKFRHAEPLQELDSITQSGGERAISTAAYLLALQELTPVPFRCVDEINQGMDSVNERLVFDLLVESTSKADTAQLFLISPKLIPNLKFSPLMKIHVVQNGPFMVTPQEWNRFK